MTNKLERKLLEIWYNKTIASYLLWPLSIIFACIVVIRKLLFRLGLKRSTRINVPVIIVGNLTVGGTGKTPTAITLVNALRQQGYRPGVITRGYKSNSLQARPVTLHSNIDQVGDEALLIAQRTQCPIWVGAKRVEVARALLKAHPEVNLIISDDGLQHYALKRNVELVVFDQRLTGNGFMLPAGPLREPLSRNRDATIINSISTNPLPNWVNTFRLTTTITAAWQLIDPSQTRALQHFKNQSIIALAGIGHPKRFFDQLATMGLSIQRSIALPDHYDFKNYDFSTLEAEIILITEKDAVKLIGKHQDPRIWVASLDAQLPHQCIQLITEKINGSKIA